MAITLDTRPDKAVYLGSNSNWVAVGHESNTAIYEFTVAPFPTGSYILRVSVINVTGSVLLGTKDLEPGPDGKIYFDAAPFLRKEFQSGYSFTGTGNESDTNNSIGFYINYQEIENGIEGTEVTDSSNLFFALNAVKHAGDQYGSNLAPYVAFDADLPEANKALFLTEFKRPRYFPGYPFGIHFAKDGFATAYQEELYKNENGGVLGGGSTELTNLAFQFSQHVELEETIPADAKFLDFMLSTDGATIACDLLTMADFGVDPWFLDQNNDELLQINVEPSISGQIASVSTYPSGNLYDATGALVDSMSHLGSGVYVPDSGPHFIVGEWRFEVPGLAVLTKTGANCTFNYEQDFENVPPIFIPGLLMDGTYSILIPGKNIFLTASDTLNNQMQLSFRIYVDSGNPSTVNNVLLSGVASRTEFTASFSFNLENNLFRINIDGLGDVFVADTPILDNTWYDFELFLFKRIGAYDVQMTIRNTDASVHESKTVNGITAIADLNWQLFEAGGKSPNYMKGRLDVLGLTSINDAGSGATTEVYMRVGGDSDVSGASTVNNSFTVFGSTFAGEGPATFSIGGSASLRIGEGHPNYPTTA